MGLISRVSSRTYRYDMDFVKAWIEQLGQRFYMDYRGQELAESLSYAIITIFTIIGIVAGYHYQQMYYSVYTCLFGIGLATPFCVPPWPFLFKRNPIKWLKPKSS